MIPPQARRWRVLAATLFLVSTVLPVAAAPAAAVSTNVVISAVYGGGGNSGATYTHDYVELFNRGTAPVSLAGWSIQYASATGTGAFGASATQLSELPSVTLDPGQYLLIQEAQGSGGTTPLPSPDVTDATPIAMSATGGKVALASVATSLGCNGSSTPCSAAQLALVVDLVGWDGANFYEAAAAPATTNTTAISRNANGCTETDNNAGDFTAGAPSPRNTASPLNPCPVEEAPAVASTFPAGGATDFPYAANLTVTFSEPVNATGAFTLSCTTSGAVDLVVSGGPTTFTLNPAEDLANGETCTLTVAAASVTDVDADDPPDAMVADVTVSFTPSNVCQQAFTPIPAIQGSGASVALTGTRTTMGVVVGDYEGPSPALRGFFIQDATGDANPATSDGIFVFEGSNANTVGLGDLVRVTGTAGENQGQSQVSVGTIVNCGTADITPTNVTFPVATADFLERYEGMLVRLPQTMSVTEHFQLGRFGQVVVSSGGRLRQPTAAVAPGAPALAMQAANNLNRIIIDDASQTQNPDPILFARGGAPLSASNTLRGGDTVTDLVGVLNYTWAGNSASGNAYRIRPVNALHGAVVFAAANARPTEAPDVDGSIRVGGMNLLNYYNTFDGSSSNPPFACNAGVGGLLVDCRGADDAGEFARQWPKTVAAILELDADVIGLNELENDGYGPDSAIAELVARLNAATAPGAYAFIDADAGTGQVNALGLDAIRVGMVYRPGVVTPVGKTAVLDSLAFVNGGDGVLRSRPSLAQAFEVNATGARFIIDTNHLKSKGSACDAPDAGDGQGNCNAVRTNAANALVDWLATDPTGTGDPDVLLVGDYNSYAMEDPIAAIEDGGYTNLIADLLGDDAYSYVFDGQWAYLDYAFASPSLQSQVAGVADYHINADEPSVLDYQDDFKSTGQLVSLYAPDEFRMSDHDPVIVGLDLDPEPQSDRPTTGTGWILSPAGALPASPSATGKAQFAFDVKYSKQGTLGGSASFTFATAGFSFVATSFDRLVTSSTLATVRGTGSVNGAGTYPFLLSGLDGTPDRFRLQVWDGAGAVVYDNGTLQPLGGGSIMVRPPK